MDVAAAAVKLADTGEGGADEEEIPDVAAPCRASDAGTIGRKRDRGAPGQRRPQGRVQCRLRATASGKRERITPDWDVARLYIGAGRLAKIRPADLVGAIVNEAGVDPRAIGAIQITERFSLVEVPDDIADGIIDTLRGSTIKGRRVPVRRDREPSRQG